jgi:hypothetical protein
MAWAKLTGVLLATETNYVIPVFRSIMVTMNLASWLEGKGPKTSTASLVWLDEI